jgi:hypothetical protein
LIIRLSSQLVQRTYSVKAIKPVMQANEIDKNPVAAEKYLND